MSSPLFVRAVRTSSDSSHYNSNASNDPRDRVAEAPPAAAAQPLPQQLQSPNRTGSASSQTIYPNNTKGQVGVEEYNSRTGYSFDVL